MTCTVKKRCLLDDNSAKLYSISMKIGAFEAQQTCLQVCQLRWKLLRTLEVAVGDVHSRLVRHTAPWTLKQSYLSQILLNEAEKK